MLGKAPNTIVAKKQSILELCRIDDASVYCELFSLADRCMKVPQKWIGKDLSSEKELSSKVQQMKKHISDTHGKRKLFNEVDISLR